MKILCLTPIKHLDGIYEYLETFGEVDYEPDMNDFDFFTPRIRIETFVRRQFTHWH